MVVLETDTGADDAVEPDRIRAILEQADPNVLRLTLYQLTQDPELAAMQANPTPLWAGALSTFTLAEEFHARVREMALDYYLRHAAGQTEPPRMDAGIIRETMNLFGHGPLTEEAYRLGAEEAAFDEFPREVQWTSRPSQDVLDRNLVVVVGAGISGIAVAVHLQRLGLPYIVLERQADLGGTWNFNKYPEVRVDSTSLIYQYKFEKRYPWKEFFSSGGETQEYLRHCVNKFGVADKITYNTELLGADWDEAESAWKLTIRTGSDAPHHLTARFVISASGLFSTPKLPDIPGIDSFLGKVVHTTQWDQDFNLEGKKVALIGTGASGAQLMPYLARHAESVAVFQRTANWVLPMEGYRANLTDELGWLFTNFPFYWNWYSYGMFFLNAQLEGLQEFDRDWQKEGGVINKRNDELRENMTAFIKSTLEDRPDLVEKVIPKYPPMARRPTVDNGWYDAIRRDNVALVVDKIDRIEHNAIVTWSGKSYPCDLIVCAVGYSTTKYLAPTAYVGRDGATISALWSKDGPRAYLGMTMPGFPNFFMLYGPSSQGRSGSFHSMSEIWARYALKSIVHVIEQGFASIECTSQAYDRYNTRLDEANKLVIWEAFGKGFYYLTDQGRSCVNSPWRGVDYHAMLFEPDYNDYSFR